jgi:hypothetical protein
MLIVFPFFYSGATGEMIWTQGDLFLALTTFLVIGIGFKFNVELFSSLNYYWALVTLTWILVANISRLFSRTQMEIVDAVYARAFFNINELWIVILLVSIGLAAIYQIVTNLRTNSLTVRESSRNEKIILTTISITVPVLWCLTLNFRN